MKIIITGASGFVGSNLSDYLEKTDNQVLPVSMRSASWQNNLDQTADAIIHLAGKAHDTKSIAEEAEYFTVNTELTKELFEKFLASDIKDFIYFSSVKAVADTVNDTLTEDYKPDPKTPYGKSKLQAEEHLLSQNLPAEKRLFIIRPCMIHGPGNKGNLNLLYKVVEKGIPWPLASFENRRSFLSIDNLNFLILKILEDRTVASGIYNFADDNSVSTNNLVEIIASGSGKPVRLWKIPQKFIQTVAKFGDTLPLPLNSEKLKKLTEDYLVSNAKIKQELNIKQLPLSAEEGLKITIESFKDS